MNTDSGSTRPTALEMARHIVSQAHRERVRLRRLSRRRVTQPPKMAASTKPPTTQD